MAINVPKDKPKNKSKINYEKIARELKGKVAFNIDLRKINSFSFGTKMALLRAFTEYKEFRNSTTFIPITRQKDESKKSFKERLRQTKKDMGQQKSHFAGIWIDTPNFAKIKKKRIKNEKGKWTTEIESTVIGRRIPFDVGFGNIITKEKFVAVDPLEFSINPKDALNALKEKYPDAAYILPVHSGYRGTGTGLDNDAFSKFAGKLNKWAFQYGNVEKKKNHWLTGFLIVWYITKPEKGSLGKPVVFETKKKTKTNKRGR